MSEVRPVVSVIIPAQERFSAVQRTLNALCTQSYPSERVEVIVVAVGCVNATREMLRGYQTPFALRIIEQPSQAAGAAQNQGATRATGALLLFLDDDVEATPPLIETHVSTHLRGAGQVVIGPSFPALQRRSSFIHMVERTRWVDQFLVMGRPGHRYSYRDLVRGNLSLDAKLFARVGGFTPTGGCVYGDYEFGMRLIKSGVRFAFAPEALGYHYKHENIDLSHTLQQARVAGCTDVRIGLRYPELRPTLKLARIEALSSSYRRLLHGLAFQRPAVGDFLACRLQYGLGLLERGRLHHPWWRLYNKLRDYWYWRGVMEEVGSWCALMRFLQSGPAHAEESDLEIEVDLNAGIEAAERRLDEERPAGVRLRYGQQAVGRIPSQPGAEGLRGGHLRPILATELAGSLLRALAMERASCPISNVARQIDLSTGRPLEAFNGRQSV